MTKQQEHSQTNQVHWGFWVGVCFFALVILSIATLCWHLVEKMSADESVPVTSVVIGGEMPYTQTRDIEVAIENVNLGNFFQVDVDEVRQRVADLPWVYSVSVRKKWPNELKIYVVDQTPVAVWNGDFLINKQGVAFQADISRVTHYLPAFFGPEGAEETALENYVNLSKLLEYDEIRIDEVMLSERYSWQLTLDDGVTLNLGRENRVQRIQRFLDAYLEIKSHEKSGQTIDYIDLRYDTGLAVGWKEVQNKTRV